MKLNKKESSGKQKSNDRDTAMYLEVRSYEPQFQNSLRRYEKEPFSGSKAEIQMEGGRLSSTISQTASRYRTDARGSLVHFEIHGASIESASIGIGFTFSMPFKDGYLLLPAAAYNGNRFESRRIPYSPKLIDERDIGKEKDMIISDIPRLNIHPGPSEISERSGSLSIPLLALYSPAAKKVQWLGFGYRNFLGDTGIRVREHIKRDALHISLLLPLVREKTRYRICDNQYPSEDIPHSFQPGEKYILYFEAWEEDAGDMGHFLEKFFLYRDFFSRNQNLRFAGFPYDISARIVRDKFNRMNWVEEYGYYSVGMRENFLQDWQIGWTGGLISSYPLFLSGDEKTRERVWRNFAWLFESGFAPSGFFWDSGEKGNKWYGGDIRRKHTSNWHLVRKSADGLFFGLKQFFLFREQNMLIPESWEKKLLGVADAFVKCWEHNRQIGQFVDSITGDIVVGGSTSGAILPAALCMAASWSGNERYLAAAKQIGRYYAERYLMNGISCGGPGDALQNPDSESGYALCESYVCLYEHTGDAEWLKIAETALHLFSTWVMAYDYEFPEGTELDLIKARTLGSVGANTQNKHGAPGICTHSGQALLRIYRYTGKAAYLRLLQQICLSLPQYLSAPGRIIPGMQEGWVTERVSTNDWFEGIGMIMKGSTWAETSLMLIWAEIPSVYADLETGDCYIFDPGVKNAGLQGDELLIEVETDVRLNYLAETGSDKAKALPYAGFSMFSPLNIGKGRKTIKLQKLKK